VPQFGSLFHHFALNPSDPTYLKLKKLELLCCLATPSNVLQIIRQVEPFCSDYNIFKASISSLSALAEFSLEAEKEVAKIIAKLLENLSNTSIVVAALEAFVLLIIHINTREQDSSIQPDNTSNNNFVTINSDEEQWKVNSESVPTEISRDSENGLNNPLFDDDDPKTVCDRSSTVCDKSIAEIGGCSQYGQLVDRVKKAVVLPTVRNDEQRLFNRVLSALCTIKTDFECSVCARSGSQCLCMSEMLRQNIKLNPQLAVKYFLSEPSLGYLPLCQSLKSSFEKEFSCDSTQSNYKYYDGEFKASEIYAMLKTNPKLAKQLFV